MINSTEYQQILNNLPHIKLSYENIIHNKVYNADILLAIPKGIKSFVWFTTYHKQNVCFIMELNENKKIHIIKKIKVSFSSDLANGSGTIFYGTKMYYLNNHFFIIEDIFYHKGINVSTNNWHNKFLLFKQILENNIKQKCYYTTFMLPVMDTVYDNLINKITNLKYKIQTIQFKQFTDFNTFSYMHHEKLNNLLNNNNNNNYINNKIINNNIINKIYTNKHQNIIQKNSKERKFIVFNVKPDIQNDIYHLYCYNNDNLVLYDTANIPNFKTSVMMNKLFRTIKENDNLDYLEESDNEDEFENENNNKFVNLKQSYNMCCSYNYKFKKWTPIQLSNNNFDKIVELKEIECLINN